MGLQLSDCDRSMLDGAAGEAVRFALSVVVSVAEALDAPDLISIEQAHIDACALMAPSNLDFVERLAEVGGRVLVPTTLSMVSLDLEHWEALGVPEAFSEPARRIADAYRKVGCVPAWTCAPYQGYLTPRYGQQIAWGESNAVAYANSVLGARTNRYPDYLDLCAAITGRVPNTGLHRAAHRRATVRIDAGKTRPEAWGSPAAWAAFGAWVGDRVGDRVPWIEGLGGARPSNDALKAFGAAAASFGAVFLFHLEGITPEACTQGSGVRPEWTAEIVQVRDSDLSASWDTMSAKATTAAVDAVILGCPHFSYGEFEELVGCIARRGDPRMHGNVRGLVFASAPMVELARRGGLLEPLQRFGWTLVRDTCPFHSPVVRGVARTVVTNSGKCAYYAPSELGADVRFGDLDACVEAAVTGRMERRESPW